MIPSLPKHPKQSDIVMYTKDYCPYCVAAKNLLTQRGVGYAEVDVTKDQKLYEEMLKKAHPQKTVPQIFIQDQSIGGYDNLKKLDTEGKLEALLFPKGRD